MISDREAVLRGLKEGTSDDIMAIARETLELYVPLARKLGLHEAADELTERSFKLVMDLLKPVEEEDSVKKDK